ncbi:MAG: hypothetical protein OXF84_08215 [Bacteroidetes bacterium]|nr:hypothetical protein [Bacteroidota bacterium]
MRTTCINKNLPKECADVVPSVEERSGASVNAGNVGRVIALMPMVKFWINHRCGR